MHRLTPLFMVVFLTSACGMGSNVQAEGESNGTGKVPRELLENVRADATQRTGRSASELTVVVAEAVTWSDASLGCAQPGMMYQQVLTPGYRIVLRAGDEELNYHAGAGGKFVLCPADRARPPSRAPGKY